MSNPLLGDDEESSTFEAKDLAESIDALLGNISRTSRPKKLAKAKKAAKPIRPSDLIVPLSVRETSLPEGAESLNIANVVNVPKQEIDKTLRSVNAETKRLTRRLMRKLVPLMLSYTSSTQYVQAAMREGLGFELAFDSNVAEAIKNIGHLNMMFHFIKHSPIPKDLKQHFMFALSTQLATKTFETLVNKPATSPSDLAGAIHAIIGGKRMSNADTSDDDSKPERKRTIPGVASRRRR